MINRNFLFGLLSILLGTAIFSVFQSCKQEDKVAELRKEVMSIHDEIMPQMGSLMKLKGELKGVISDLDSVQDITKIEYLNSIINELENADNSMMEWMRNYNDPPKDMEQQKALNYLNNEKEQIQRVKFKFEISSQKAKKELSIKSGSNE